MTQVSAVCEALPEGHPKKDALEFETDRFAGKYQRSNVRDYIGGRPHWSAERLEVARTMMRAAGSKKTANS